MRFKKLSKRKYLGTLVIFISFIFLLSRIGLPFLFNQSLSRQDVKSTAAISGAGFVIGTYLLAGPLAALIAIAATASAAAEGGCTGCAGGGGEEAPSGPTIAYSPTSFSFSAAKDGPNPSSQTLSIWNSGEDTLDWSVSDDAAWLSLSPISGSSTGEEDSVTVSVDISGLSAGTHSATITISAPGATNTPQTVPVGLTIELGEPPQPPEEG